VEAFAWPASVVVIIIIALVLFRKALGRFLDRAESIGPHGVKASPAKQESGKEVVGPSAADEFMRLFDNALLVTREEWLRGELKRILGNDETQREKVLIRIIAAQSIVQQFEATYRSIWGSQLSALELANTAGIGGLDRQLFEILYSQAKARDPQYYEHYSFNQWLGFVEASGLVITKDQKVYITLEGGNS
jgi:hypothetical protein